MESLPDQVKQVTDGPHRKVSFPDHCFGEQGGVKIQTRDEGYLFIYFKLLVTWR